MEKIKANEYEERISFFNFLKCPTGIFEGVTGLNSDSSSCFFIPTGGVLPDDDFAGFEGWSFAGIEEDGDCLPSSQRSLCSLERSTAAPQVRDVKKRLTTLSGKTRPAALAEAFCTSSLCSPFPSSSSSSSSRYFLACCL